MRLAVIIPVLLAVVAWVMPMQAGPVAGGPASRSQFSVRVVPDVAYLELDGSVLRLDLTLPDAQPGLRPTVLYLHGGAWRSGGRADPDATHFAPALATRGYVVASADYRLSDVAVWPAAFHDCKMAVRWLKANSASYGIDPERIAVVGYSAGAHLAALLGTTTGIAAEDGPAPLAPDVSVRAVVAISGVYDTEAHYRQRSSDAVRQFLGGSPGEVPDRCRLSSPIRFAGRAVPHLLVHGMNDKTVAFGQAKAFEHALRDAGVRVQTLYIENAGHALPLDGENLARIVERVDSFLKELW
jgi:acetyl esterase/lipase